MAYFGNGEVVIGNALNIKIPSNVQTCCPFIAGGLHEGNNYKYVHMYTMCTLPPDHKPLDLWQTNKFIDSLEISKK